MIITFSIKDIHGVADCICPYEHTLVFARFALRNQEELRGLRYAIKKEKWITIAGEHYQASKQAQLWPERRVVKGKGITLWTLTAYNAAMDDDLFFIHETEEDTVVVAGKFSAFLHQHTPYPVPPVQDVGNILNWQGERLPVEGSDAVAVYRFSKEKIIEVLEALP